MATTTVTLTPEQLKENQKNALKAELSVLIVELDQHQSDVAEQLGLETDDLTVMARNAFASVLRGKCESVINKAIKDKYIADTKNKKAVSDELEKEIQLMIRMKRSIS